MTKTMTDKIISKYIVRATIKPGKDLPRKKLCGMRRNPDGRSFDIPAHQADYYRTLLASDYDISEPFMPEEKSKKEELEKVVPPGRLTYEACEKAESLGIIVKKEEILNAGEYKCWCGFKTYDYKKFDKHVYKHEEERKKAERERKKAEREGVKHQETQPAGEPNNSGITFMERVPTEIATESLFSDGDNYMPTKVNAQAENKE